MLQGKHIVLGISGSIAAYKACFLIRLLIRAGAEVQVVITPAGKEFITPVTLSALTSKPVVSDFFSQRDGTWHSHVALGQWADAMVVAPATASTIGKMANGIADNMLITTYLSMKAPVFVAPAMDLDMFAHPATQQNIARLRAMGNHVIEPTSGELASHLVGKGRMEEPEKIVEVLTRYFDGMQMDGDAVQIHGDAVQICADAVPVCRKALPLAGKRILITAGPTYEKIDPVRFIGNYSTGKMGFALAEECAARGAEVDLVCGPVRLTTDAPNVHRTDVESTSEMHAAAVRLFPAASAAILCAAVADFTVADVAGEKIKRGAEGMDLKLAPTPDIAAALGQMKTSRQRLVGFALETTDGLANARKKLEKKRLDFVVLNSLRDKGAGFGHDTNKVTLVSSQGETAFPLKPKREVASDIIDRLCSILD